MEGAGRIRKIVVTGPESTGKTTLSKLLADNLKADWIPEYARFYIENLQRPYNIHDLERIAEHQISQERVMTKTSDKGILIMDTWLIMTKVWFEVVYGSSPDWIEKYIAEGQIDLFLVCKPDLPWIPDPVRENGGEMRERLFERYCSEIEQHGFLLEVVEGCEEIRLENALRHIKDHRLV